jgi:ribonuclease III
VKLGGFARLFRPARPSLPPSRSCWCAVTHASLGSPNRPDNQRLEFLGDRVLGLVMAEALLAADPDAREGQLAPRYNALVRKETCAEVARELGLGDVLRLGRSEMLSGGRRKEALLGDAMEAVIAAVHLDAGFEAARELVLRLWGARVARAETTPRDAKTALQEFVQARGRTAAGLCRDCARRPRSRPAFHRRGAAGRTGERRSLGRLQAAGRTGRGQGAAGATGGIR